MRNLITTCLLITLFYSCTSNDSRSPDNNLPYVTAIVTTAIMDDNDIPNAVFELTVDAPFNNVESYDMSVRFRPHNGDPATDFLPLLSVTSFPTDIVITTADLAAAFSLEISDFSVGDYFDFVSTSTGFDDTTINYNDLPEDLQIEGEQAYLLDTKIVCPLPEGLYTGDYLIETTIDGCFGGIFITHPVELIEHSLCQRTFGAVPYSQFNDFVPDTIFIIEFLCGSVTLRDDSYLGIGCAGGPLILHASESALSYSETDDSTLIVNFVEDCLGCGGSENGEAQITLTKL